ncbi:MAG TPA: leucine/isoleucine/valine transporter permease subunit [Candidatus Limnocylindria bacterium]|nr:leucine/isoleucine/valine transporter permease subunit [Candidatus Limnocylindria bacterium]
MNDTMLGRFYRRAAGLGLLGTLGAVYVALIGIVERFEPRNIVTGYLTLGLLTAALVVFVTAYRATEPPHSWGIGPPPRQHVLGAGVLAAVIGAAGVALFLVLNRALPLDAVLVNANDRMSEILGLGLEFPAGALALLGAGLAFGVAAGGLRLLAPRFRGPLIAAVVAVMLVSLMEPFMRVVLLQLGQNAISGFFYQSGGLTVPGAIIVAGAVLAIGLANSLRGEAVRERVAEMPADQRRGIQIALFVVGIVFLLVLPQLIGSFLSEVVGTVGLYILMGLGLNIVVGYAGLLDLGYVAFFAIGAYATAILTSPVSVLGWGLSFWVAIPIVMLIAALSGLIIGAPVLRLRGDYLAIVTLGIGEIVRILLLSDALRPWTGGAQGILQVPPPEFADIDFFQPQNLYYPILAFVVLGAFVAISLANSRVGRAWNAMREDEDVAAATGINITNYKLLAFSLGAVFGCIAGAFLAVKLGSIFPHNLNLLVSITVLSLIILGGMGSIPGVIVGAFVLVGLPELLREFAEYRLLIYGAVLIVMMLWRPEGLIPSAQRKRELREHEDDEDQWAHQTGVPTAMPAVERPGP